MRRLRNNSWIALPIGLLALVAGIWWGGHPQALPAFARDALVEDDVATRAEVIEAVRENFYKPVTEEKLQEQSLKGIVRSLDDRFSEYYTPKEAEQVAQSLSGEFEGVGMTVDSRDTEKGLRVARVFPKSPAKEAGIKPGDLITEVNGESIAGDEAEVSTAKIRGEAGTEVKLTIKSPDEKPREETLERRQLAIPLVASRLVEKGGKDVAHVRLVAFDQGASEQLRKQIDRRLKAGAQGILLDLRGNGGGSLDEGILVASTFLKEGQLVVTTRGRTQPEQKLEARGDAIESDIPVVVLVDRNSASASEIVAGALRDHDRADVVGTKTFGKGVFQQLEPLGNEGLLKLTVGSYFLPDGKNLAGDGIEPPVKARDKPRTARDEALPVALRELRSKLD